MFPHVNNLNTETESYGGGLPPKNTITDPKTILIVDDSPAVLNELADGLETFGYKTRVASHDKYAKKIILEEDIDCVLLDSVLSKRSGIDMLQFIKRIDPKIPIIMIAEPDQVNYAVRCFKLGAVDLLTKPIVLEALLPRLERAFRLPLPEGDHIRAHVIPDLEGFRMIRVLGEGSMGIVYLVEKDVGDGSFEFYALKSFKLILESDDETRATLKERFTIEAKAAYTIQHPNVIKVHDYAMDKDGVPYILMEYFEGVNPKIRLRENTLSLGQKMWILQQIAEALSSVHENDICHRDLKLSNILINEELKIKVMDFGIARIKNSTLTPTRQVMGTPAYMSPEAFSTSKVDHRSDIFSLGSITYEILTGERAFPGTNLSSLAHDIRFNDPVWPRKMGVDIPKPVEKGLKQMLAKKPEKRVQNAQELYELFSQYSEPN